MRDEYAGLSDIKKKASKGPHPDYEGNLAWAVQFIHGCQNRLKEGMRVQIGGTHGLERSVVKISWRPPIEAKKGNHANHIFLHQPRAGAVKEVEQVFKSYVRMITRWEERLAS
jgi:hypothetical protein